MDRGGRRRKKERGGGWKGVEGIGGERREGERESDRKMRKAISSRPQNS